MRLLVVLALSALVATGCGGNDAANTQGSVPPSAGPSSIEASSSPTTQVFDTPAIRGCQRLREAIDEFQASEESDPVRLFLFQAGTKQAAEFFAVSTVPNADKYAGQLRTEDAELLAGPVDFCKENNSW